MKYLIVALALPDSASSDFTGYVNRLVDAELRQDNPAAYLIVEVDKEGFGIALRWLLSQNLTTGDEEATLQLLQLRDILGISTKGGES